MPIESADSLPADGSRPKSIGAAYLTEARASLKGSLAKIAHCLDQLDEPDLQWRPHASHNSMQTILLHLAGNIRQWIIAGVGDQPDTRDRPAEFAPREPIAKAELLGQLEQTLTEADAVLAACDPGALLDEIRVQGFQTTRLAAVFDSVSHFVGHTHQIVYITRLRLGDNYRFQWKPIGKEQGA